MGHNYRVFRPGQVMIRARWLLYGALIFMWLTNSDTLPGTNIRIRLLSAFVMALLFHPFCYFDTLLILLKRKVTFLGFTLLIYIGFSYLFFGTSENAILRNEFTLLILMVWTFLLVKKRTDLESLVNVLLFVSLTISGAMIYHGIIVGDVNRLIFSTRMNPNIQAYVLAMAIPLAFYKLSNINSKARIPVYCYSTAIIVFLVAVIGTGSRGGFLVAVGLSLFGGGGLYLASKKYNIKRLLQLVFSMATILTILFIVIPHISFLSKPLQRISILNDIKISNIDEMDTMQSRIPAQRAALSAWKENPIWGVGYGEFLYRTQHYSINSHNTYIEVLAELGLVGLLLYGYLLLHVIKNMYRHLGYHGLGVGLFFIIAPLGSNIFLTFHLFYVVIALSAVTYPLQER
jgi:O-antigen ligase